MSETRSEALDLSQSRKSLAGRRILVVEDEIILGLEAIDELTDVGALPVGPIPTVAEALDLLESDRFDLAIINVFLRGEASFPIAQALTDRGIPFLFVTGNDDFIHEHFPNVPRHPKPTDMPKLIQALALLAGQQA